MDIVVGSLGGLKKLFDEGYLRKSRVVEVGIDEVDSMLDDTFRWKSQHCAKKYSQFNPANLVLKNYPLFQPRDETLAFLRQFGSSGQAVISGVNKLLTPLSASAIETWGTYLNYLVHQMRVTMAGATFPTNFDTNISEVMNPEVLFSPPCECSDEPNRHIFLPILPTPISFLGNAENVNRSNPSDNVPCAAGQPIS